MSPGDRMIIAIFALALVLAAGYAFTRPETEYSPDGMWFRITNPDDVPYSCWIELGNGEYYEKAVYPNSYTRWYPAQHGFKWDCNYDY